MVFFDAHCHLQDERLVPEWPGVLARARRAGVLGIAVKGARESDWSRVAALAEREKGLHPSFGLHPWFLGERSGDWMAALEARLVAFPEAGVGEIGLDPEPKGDGGVPMEEQEEVFKAQLALAVGLDRAVSIHVRGAWGRLLALLDEVDFPERWMVHCFGGSVEVARVLLARGAYLSFSGTVTRVNNRRAVAVLPAVPVERLLVETDAPDLLPRGAVGPLNEPANVVRVVERVAAIRGESVGELAEQTDQNARRFFGVT